MQKGTSNRPSLRSYGPASIERRTLNIEWEKKVARTAAFAVGYGRPRSDAPYLE
jgi:hypothetical protein